MSRTPLEFENYPLVLKMMAPFGPYRAVMRNAVDGDTVDLLLDQGLNQYRYARIRLADIYAKERFRGTLEERVQGKAAWEHLQTLLPNGTHCVVWTTKAPIPAVEELAVSFDRYVGKIATVAFADVGQQMIDDGFATPTP